MSVTLVAALGRQGRLVVAPLRRKAGGFTPPLLTQLAAHSRPNAGSGPVRAPRQQRRVPERQR
jgi:hypothetical protein